MRFPAKYVGSAIALVTGLSFGVPVAQAAGTHDGQTAHHQRWSGNHHHYQANRSEDSASYGQSSTSHTKKTTNSGTTSPGSTPKSTSSGTTSPGSTPKSTQPVVNGSTKTIAGRPVIAVYHMKATAYGPSLKDNYPYGPTNYFGQPLSSGTVAVDPSVIPLKSTLYVTGYHDAYLPQGGFVGKALDTGGAIKGNRIDIFMNQGAGAVSNFGIQPVTVYVLG